MKHNVQICLQNNNTNFNTNTSISFNLFHKIFATGEFQNYYILLLNHQSHFLTSYNHLDALGSCSSCTMNFTSCRVKTQVIKSFLSSPPATSGWIIVFTIFESSLIHKTFPILSSLRRNCSSFQHRCTTRSRFFRWVSITTPAMYMFLVPGSTNTF